MAVDYELWTVFVAMVLPFVPYQMVGLEKYRRGIYDPANPRDSNALLAGWSARAKAAEANSWEALLLYLAVSYVSREAGADLQLSTALGVAWIAARLLYLAVYVAGFGRIRIAVWFVGVGLILARFAVCLV